VVGESGLVSRDLSTNVRRRLFLDGEAGGRPSVLDLPRRLPRSVTVDRARERGLTGLCDRDFTLIEPNAWRTLALISDESIPC
jgi:hypothetical protein